MVVATRSRISARRADGIRRHVPSSNVRRAAPSAASTSASVASTRKLRATWPEAEVLDATDCVVTPGLVNAHQHLTGDPLARSSIPDLLEPGRSIFEWSVPLHGAHTPDDDELAATICAAESL